MFLFSVVIQLNRFILASILLRLHGIKVPGLEHPLLLARKLSMTNPNLISGKTNRKIYGQSNGEAHFPPKSLIEPIRILVIQDAPIPVDTQLLELRERSE